MEKTYAYVNKTSYLIENMVVWDGVSPFVPPNGFEFVEVPTEGVYGDWSSLGIGWAYVNGEFIEPPNPNPTPTPVPVGGTPNVIA
jgi:hypothetical protein